MCFDCADWDECSGCAINVMPVCEGPLEHSSTNESGLTLETLSVDGGYWLATSESDIILTCYNADACTGELTGADSFCASGYKGPCEGFQNFNACFWRVSIGMLKLIARF